MAIFHYKNIQIHLRKNQCMRLKQILSMSDEYPDFEELDYKLYHSYYQNIDNINVHINMKEFLWIKNNMHLSRC